MHQSKNATIRITSIKLYILLALSSIFLASCGGSSSNGSSGGNSGSTITVGLFKGPVEKASCDITDASGKPINRKTEQDGLSIDSSNISPGILTVSCSGGTYIDEATNEKVDAPNMRAVAYYPGGDFKIIISPLSEIAYQRAIAVAGNVDSLDESKVNAESEAVATLFGLDGINTLKTIPTPIVGPNAEPAKNDPEGRFAMVLAGLSKMIYDSQGGTSTAQVEAGIDALVRDLAKDGVFNTKGSLIAGINDVVVSNPSIDSTVDTTTLTTAISNATLDATATLTAVEAPLISVSTTTQYVYVVNTAITDLVYRSIQSSGGATECSISSLPQGLQLNGTTTLTVAPNRFGQCVISGTPSTVTATASYTLTVSNAIGSESTEISLTVNPEAPNVADVSAQTLTKGTPATITFGNAGGTITSCTLDVTSDSLTGTGLSLNSNDCSITGTPNTVTTLNIVVAATNATATDTANVPITINDEAPALQDIPTKQIFVLNVDKTITFNNAGGGTLTECSVSPALPTGLTIAPNSTNTTCEITGSATTETPVETYTITAKNATAQSTADVAIEVVNIIPVNVVPITSSVSENAGSVVAFRIETTPAPSSDLTGTLNFGGDASTGGHASTAKNTFTIAADTTSTTLSINLTDNEYPNSARAFIAQVGSVSDATYGPGATGSLEIADNDAPYTVTVSGTNAPLTEADNATLTFTISTDRAVATNDTVTVDLSYGDSSTTADVSGTSDFSNIPTQVVISADENSATLELPLVNDNTVERTEYVNAAISNATNAHGGSFAIGNSQTATINDNDTYQISITQLRNGAENNNNSPTSAQFVVTVTPTNETGGDITGTLIYGGSADQGTDYTAKNTFSISNGASSDTIELPIIENPNGEGNQTIEVSINTSTISVSGGYDYSVAQDSATASIIDDDITQITINRVTENVTESSATGVELFTVSVLNADGSLMTNNGLGAISGTITFSGDAFTGNDVTTPSATTFNFPLGSIANPQTITFNINQDTTPENTEQITAQITAVVDGVNADSYSVNANPVSVDVVDDSDNYTITIGSPVNATEGGTNPQFTLTTNPAVASGDTITVNLSYTGSADTTGTSDFSNLPDSATITTGTTGTLTLTLATDDGIVELDETVIATIDSATNANGINLNIGTPNNSSTATINDNDTHSVSITKATDGDGTEDSNDNTLEFVISVTPPNTQADITGTLILSGTNIDANDFTGVDNFPNVPFTITTSDNGSQTITIGIADPDDAEGLETVIATLNNSFTSGGYSTTVASSPNNSANATITDNDITAVKIRALPTTVAESDTNQTISYEVYLDGSAVGGAINPVSGTITFSGALAQVLDSTAQPFNITSGSAQTIQLTLIGDTTPEAVSTLTATIDPNSITNTAQFQASSPDNSATITITDDDNYTITIGSPVNATEGGTNPQFTLTTDPAVDSGDTITVNLSYTGSADTTDASDFSNLPDSATITTGTTGTLILTLATDDGIVELDETVIATIDSATNANGISLNIGTPNNSSTATINDNDTHSVSITKATDGDGTEDSNDNTLEFVISVTPPNTQADITGTLILSGTNIDANDFTGVDNFPNVPFTITTSDNGSQTITIGIADPDDAEGLETVIATLNNSFTSGGYSTTVASSPNNSANATITDNDITAVKIRALPTTVAESDTNQTISYEVYLDGSAVGGAINPVSGTITFSGALAQVLDSTAQPFNITSGSAQTIQLTLIGDTTPEAVSTLTATIDPNSITNTAQFQASSPDNSATITITDDDNYTITIGSPVNATEGGTNPQFTLTTDPAVDSGDTITVNLSYTGSADTTDASDFSNLPDSATITTGTTGTLILTLATDDGIVELDETVIATIDSATNANGISLNIGTPNNSSTATINDNDTHSVSITKATDGDGTEDSNDNTLEFVISVTPPNTQADITGTLILSGTNIDANDFTGVDNFPNVPFTITTSDNGSQTITIGIADPDDAEGLETVIATLNNSFTSGGYSTTVASSPNNSANATITDNDITAVKIRALPTTVAESDTNQTISYEVYLDGSAVGGAINPVSGTITFSGALAQVLDSTAQPFNITSGSAQTIQLTLIGDTTPEAVSTLTATIDPNSITNTAQFQASSPDNSATITITDDDNYTITIGSPVNATEGGTNPQFTLTTDPAVDSGDTITVNLSYTGSADTTDASDFSNLPDSATITTGTTGTLILTLATDDGIVELDETITATIDSATNANGVNLNIGTPNNSSTATINDNDTYQISITQLRNGAENNNNSPTSAQFVVTVTPTNETGGDITGTLIYGGSADQGTDYTAKNTFSISNGASSDTIELPIIENPNGEGNQTIEVSINTSTISVSGGYDYSVAQDSATASIIDDDITQITINRVTENVTESSATGVELFTVSVLNADGSLMTNNGLGAISGTITFSGDAFTGNDVTTPSATTFNFPLGSIANPQTITFNINQDTTPENTEQITAQITAVVDGVNADSYSVNANPVSVDVVDDSDNYTITIGSPVNATEGGTNPQFTLTTNPAVASGDTITVNLSYTGSADTTGTSDFSNLPDSATITTGTTGTLTLTLATDDGIVELDETVIATIDSATNANGINLNIGTPNNSSTATINDNDTHSVSITKATDGDGTEDSNDNTLEFVISVTPPNTQADITGTLILSGTNIDANDFTGVDNFPNVPFTITTSDNGSQTITIGIADPDDAEGLETVIATLNNSFTSGGYSTTVASSPNNSANATITDNDAYTISIESVANAVVTEGDGNKPTFRVVANHPVLAGDSINVAISYTGSASGSDDISTPTTVTIPAGATSATYTVDVVDDNITESNESFTIALNDSQAITTSNGIAVNRSSTLSEQAITYTINNDDIARVSFNTASSSANEGDSGTSSAAVTLSMTNPSSAATTITYTVDGTANNPDDHTLSDGTITIPAGQTAGTITIPNIIGDNVVEDDETVIIAITDANGAELGSTLTHTYTINNDDIARVSFNTASSSANEGDSGTSSAAVTLSMTNPSSAATTITYTVDGTANNPDDHILSDGTITIPAGQTAGTITIPNIIGDNVVEDDETVIIAITDANGAELGSTLTHTYTITNDDTTTLQFASGLPTSGLESATALTLTVTLTNPAAHTITADVTANDSSATSGGTDYTLPNSVTINAGDTVGIISITINDDNTVEGTETIVVDLSNVSGITGVSLGSPVQHTYNITNDDTTTVNFDASSSSADEGNSGTSSAAVTLSMTNPSSAATTITYTVDGTANNSSDHTLSDGTITIPAGQTAGTITIPNIIGDNVVEDDETVIIAITDANGAELGSTLTHTYTINNDDIARVSFNTASSSANEGDSGTSSAAVTLSMTNPSSAATTITYTVDGTANNPDDHTLSDGTITIPAGQTAGTITIPNIIGDNVVEDDETVIIAITDANGAELGSTLTHTYTINNDDIARVSFNTASSSANEGDSGTSSAAVTLSMTNPSSAATTITYTVDGTANNPDDHILSDGTITIPAGQTAGTITIPNIIGDNVVEDDETVIIAITDANGAELGSTLTHTYTITNDDTTTLQFASGLPTSGLESATALTLTVTLTNPAAHTITADVTANDSSATSGGTDYTLPNSVTINAGDTVGIISITINDDNTVEGTETIVVDLSNVSGITGVSLGSPVQHTYNITNDDTTTVNFDASSSSADEGNSGTSSAAVTLSMTNPSSAATTITYTVDGTANNPDDHTLSDGTITIPAGQTAGTITIPNIIGDNVVEDDETVIIAITDANGAELGSTLTHTYTINNDDIARVSFNTASSSANEGDSGTSSAAVTLSMTNPSSAATTITYTVDGTANNPDDHTLSDGTITIPAGQTAGTITIPNIIGDNVVEDDETVIIAITDANGAELGSTLTHTYTITNDDTTTVNFAASSSSADEATSSAAVTLSMTNPSSAATTITYTVGGTANNPDDHNLSGGTITIPAGQTAGTISITINDDNTAEGTETIVVELSNVSGIAGASLGSLVQHTYSILPSDPTNISGNSGSAYTATVNIAFTQSFTNTATNATACTISPVLPMGMSISVVNGTCEISGTPTDDLAVVSHTVSAGNAGGTSTATISFEVVDAPNITALQPLVQVVQGQNINQPITLTSNSGGPITEYGMVAANGLEVDENIPGLNFDTLTGQLSGNVQFTAAVGIATYTITATGPNGATSQATIQIQVTQGLQAPQISDLTYNATTEIAIPASTVVLPNTGGAIDIWEITGTGVTGPVSNLYTIGNGLTFNQLTGEVGGTPAGPAAETNYTVSARNNSGFSSATLTLTVLSKPVSNVNVPMTITSYPIMSGQTESNIDVRVEVDTNATTNTYEVEYRFKSDNSGNWLLNLRTATPFTGTLPDFATYNNGDTLSYRVTVTNAQNAINIVTKESTVSTSSTYSISDSRVIEGVDGTKTMVFTIVREGNTSTSGSVEFAVDASSSAGSVTTIADLANTYESGTGTVDNDYVGATSGTVTFPASGAQVQTIAFTINGDYWKEFNQKIVVTIGTPTGGTILRSTGIGVINEVDAGAMTGLFALTDLNPEKVTYAIRVRRSSDNVEQDIGFDHNGNLDTTALLAFVGTGANDHGYVSVWYDQSDYDQNLTQVNRDQQGTIVSAGQLVVGSTGEPVISFNEGLNGAYDGFNNDFDYMQMTGNSASVENLVIDFTMQVNTATSSALANFGQTNQNGNYGNRITIHPMNLAAGGGETTFFDSNKGNINNSAPDATKQTLGELEQVSFALSRDNNANAGTATLNNTDAARVMFINGESVSNHAGGLLDNIVLGPTWYIGAAAATTQNVDLHQPIPVMLSEFSLYESNELQTAANAFTGSSNNDVFTYAGDLENIDGSAGYDALYINSNTTPTITLDTTANSATSTLGVNSIERIIAAGNGQNDVITITDALVDSTDEDVIEIQMDSTDTLTLPNSFNVGSSATETYNGISYTVYTHNTNTALRVFVSGSPTVSN